MERLSKIQNYKFLTWLLVISYWLLVVPPVWAPIAAPDENMVPTPIEELKKSSSPKPKEPPEIKFPKKIQHLPSLIFLTPEAKAKEISHPIINLANVLSAILILVILGMVWIWFFYLRNKKE